MEDADAIANSQRPNTLAAWEPTEWMRVKELDGAMKITAFAFETLQETEDQGSLAIWPEAFLFVPQAKKILLFAFAKQDPTCLHVVVHSKVVTTLDKKSPNPT